MIQCVLSLLYVNLDQLEQVCFNRSWTVKFYLPASRRFVKSDFPVKGKNKDNAVFTVDPRYNEGPTDWQ